MRSIISELLLGLLLFSTTVFGENQAPVCSDELLVKVGFGKLVGKDVKLLIPVFRIDYTKKETVKELIGSVYALGPECKLILSTANANFDRVSASYVPPSLPACSAQALFHKIEDLVQESKRLSKGTPTGVGAEPWKVRMSSVWGADHSQTICKSVKDVDEGPCTASCGSLMKAYGAEDFCKGNLGEISKECQGCCNNKK